ncbi:unnamed protein product [Effrenium voratum]|uniref:Apple domain-containing protein n=1 Tax=Effrenium voratum TaxID=2562239 RepID=A0AA36N0B0_9DINO|nr:unnamed protein product [Effrenium voratum]CAJ1387315.1 unnamed protein product [Effrenium voratum]CAJ1424806.1 unnamed protein product [Effrenium voratum]
MANHLAAPLPVMSASQPSMEEMQPLTASATPAQARIARLRRLCSPLAILLTALAMTLALATAPISAVSNRLRRSAQDLAVTRLAEAVVEDVPEGCFKQGMYYGKPFKMQGSKRTVEASPRDCQLRCRRDYKCAQFSWWPDGGCLLTDEGSILEATPFKWSGVVVGPRNCQDLTAFEAATLVEGKRGDAFCHGEALLEGPSAGLSYCMESCDGLPKCNYFSLWSTGDEHWCRLTQHCQDVERQKGQVITIYKRREVALPGNPLEPASAAKLLPVVLERAKENLPGINGTSCAAYPGCVAMGLLKGNCCPDGEHVTLECCSGLPPPAEMLKLPRSECSAFPRCVSANMTGACCPTPEGVRLACCP